MTRRTPIEAGRDRLSAWAEWARGNRPWWWVLGPDSGPVGCVLLGALLAIIGFIFGVGLSRVWDFVELMLRQP